MQMSRQESLSRRHSKYCGEPLVRPCQRERHSKQAILWTSSARKLPCQIRCESLFQERADSYTKLQATVELDTTLTK